MSEQQNGAQPDQEKVPSKIQPRQYNKEATILAILRAGQSLNRFEAERLGDHCLHSTIATLRRKGFQFRTEWEWVNTRFQTEVHVKRYWYVEMP